MRVLVSGSSGLIGSVLLDRLAGARVVPSRLSASGYTFELPTIDAALEALLTHREGEARAVNMWG